MGWKPIDEAPKDGTEVDLWVGLGGGYRVSDAIWIRGKWHEWGIGAFRSMERVPVDEQHLATHFRLITGPETKGGE